MTESVAPSRRTIAIALAAAWLGWGFDVFDAHLLAYVSEPVLKSLLHDPPKPEINRWLADLTAIFLVGWAVGGIVFGRLTDTLGRARTMLVTMILYGGGTAACALCHTLPTFVACRLVASVGIGGEWAAGASLVAEVAPDRLRPLLGALLYTASPLGQLVTSSVAHHVVDDNAFGLEAETWRAAFLLGLAPTLVAFVLRAFVAEPARWKAHETEHPSALELFGPALRRRTLTGLSLASVALVAAWGMIAFVPKALREWATAAHVADVGATVDRGNWTILLGATLGVLVTVPATRFLGRRGAFAVYFGGALVLAQVTLGADLELESRMRLLFPLGFFAHGLFGIFPFYLPELFPTRLRGSGAGFCYSTGRIASAVGALFVGDWQATHGLTATMRAVGLVYVVGLVTLPFAVETRGEVLE
jgi:MFS family permease